MPRCAECGCAEPPFDHWQSCLQVRGRFVTHRHNFILNTLGTLIRDCNGAVWIEPRVITAAGRRSAGDQRGLRPDAIAATATARYMIDVSVVHPTAPSYAHRPKSAATREADKVRVYGAYSQREGCVFVPFVLESYGAWGARAADFLHVLSRAASPDPLVTSAYYRRACVAISVALQRGNAHIPIDGIRASRVRHTQAAPRFIHAAIAPHQQQPPNVDDDSSSSSSDDDAGGGEVGGGAIGAHLRRLLRPRQPRQGPAAPRPLAN